MKLHNDTDCKSKGEVQSPNQNSTENPRKKTRKSIHVPTACINCKKAHLACDLSRPCKRCVSLDKSDTCIDIKHKKRGRPKLTAATKWQSPITPITTINHHFHTLNNFKNYKPIINSPALLSSIPSSFKLTDKPCFSGVNDREPLEAVTMLLSMDLCCARVSDESIQFFGKNPKDLDFCSFYNIVDSKTTDTVSRIHRTLLDNCHQQVKQPITFLPATSDLFYSHSPLKLLTIANGSQTLKCELKFKSKDELFDCQFYLGGGLGGDLFHSAHLDQIYIVCLISKGVKTITKPLIEPQPPLLLQPQQLFPTSNSDVVSLCDSNSINSDSVIDLVNQLCDNEHINNGPFTPPNSESPFFQNNFSEFFNSAKLLDDFLFSDSYPLEIHAHSA